MRLSLLLCAVLAAAPAARAVEIARVAHAGAGAPVLSPAALTLPSARIELETPPLDASAEDRFDGLRVNVAAGVPRGGFGDVAANVTMAQQLKALMPGADVRLLVGEASRKLVETLLPDYDHSLGERQIGGLRVMPGDAVPSADLALGFALSDALPKELSGNATASLWFDEFEELGNRTNAGYFESHRRYVGRIARGLTSGAGGNGVYVLPVKPAAPMTRGELLSALGETALGVRLGFSYAHWPGRSLAYARAAALAAKRRPDVGHVLVINDMPALDAVELPSNLRLKRLPSSSLALSEAALAHSDLPVMTTGDVSLSLALQYEKPLFYEPMSWKEPAIAALVRLLEKRSPTLGALAWRDTVLMSRDSSGDDDVTPERLLPFFDNPAFQEAFESAVRATRSTLSLPLLIRDLVRSFQLAGWL